MKTHTIRSFAWMRLLIHIDNTHVSAIARYLDISIAHAYHVSNEFVEKGWVIKLGKKKRCRKFELTEKGKAMRVTVINFMKGIGDENVEAPLKPITDNINIFGFVKGEMNE